MAATPLTYAPIQVITIVPTAALAKRRFVGMTGVGYCGALGKALGVTPDDYDLEADVAGACITEGIVFVEASAAISAGAAVASAANGKAVAASTMTATVPSTGTTVTSSSAQPAMTIAGSVLPQAINGYALDAASADGDFIRVKLV